MGVRVAPNGQQFTAAGQLSLELYAPPQGLASSPSAGPAAGGTVVTVSEAPRLRNDACMYAGDGKCVNPNLALALSLSAHPLRHTTRLLVHPLPTRSLLTTPRCDEPWRCDAGTDCSDCSVALG